MDDVAPNLFDLLPNVRRSFRAAAAKLRMIAAEKFHHRAPQQSAVTAAVTCLEAAAKSAEQLIPHVVGLHDAEIHPDVMAAYARDVAATILVDDWHALETKASALVDLKWLDVIEEWGKEVGVGEDAAA